MAKRSNGIAFAELGGFIAKRPKEAGRSHIAFSTFSRGNSTDAATISRLSQKPSMTGFHHAITPDNKIEDPSISPIIITFALTFNETDAKTFNVSPSTVIPKGTIVCATYKHDDSQTQVARGGAFKGLKTRPFHKGSVVHNNEVITVVAAESCRGGDATTNNTCLMSGAVADTTELCMVGARQYKKGDLVYASKSKTCSAAVGSRLLNNECFEFHQDNTTEDAVLKFIVVYPQQGLCNAMVTILPLFRHA